MKAKTIKEISGACIPTIPIGTEFTVNAITNHYANCDGLPITSIYNWEYEIMEEPVVSCTQEDMEKQVKAVAQRIAYDTEDRINLLKEELEFEFPYKAQWILEETIKILQEKV